MTNRHWTRAEVLDLWTKLEKAGYVVTLVGVTHPDMIPATVYQLFVGPSRMRFSLEDLNEIAALPAAGYTLEQPLDGSDPRWAIKPVPEPRP